MDLNPPENLDPKLKEAYERIMGQKIPTPIIQNRVLENQTQDNVVSNPNEESSATYDDPKSTPTRYEETSHEKGHKTLFIIITIGVLIFLIGYAVVWAKIFNLV